MSTYTFWRLRVTANQGARYTAIGEVELRGAAGGSDLATGGTATASSDDGSNAAANAFDDDAAATAWRTAQDRQIAWLQYEFSTPVTLKEVVLTLPSTAGAMAAVDEAPESFTLQASDDGVHWIDWLTVTGEATWAFDEARTYTADLWRVPVATTVADEQGATTATSRPVRVFSRATGLFLGRLTTDANGQGEVVIPHGGAVDVIAIDDYGDIWRTGETINVGDRCIPTIPNGHYYEATVGGTTGASEPAWPVDESTVTDNDVTWEDQGTLREPVIDGPFVPLAL